MIPRIGDLCSGYHGLGGAAETVTGGRTTWLCEIEPAPASLLAYRFPHLHNYGDLKALEWADDPVDVLTAGYPCSPFSGAGKRLGLNDPRHLFPWIARGIERMRPPLVLLENVRGHLSLGFDVVLAELDRIGYDVRWTLLRAADVGAPHGRSRLWIAARAREAGGWPQPGGEPSALAEGGGWTDPASGLFGSIPARRPGTAGVMVEGLRWDSDAVAVNSGTLLPTPTAHDDGKSPEAHAAMKRRMKGGPRDTITSLSVLARNGMDPLLPTPRATDGTKGGPNQRGSSGDLMLPSAVVQLLPTPAATDANGARNSTAGRQAGSQHHSGDTLGDLIFDGRLLPTPVAAGAAGAGASTALDSLRSPHPAIEAARMALLPTPEASDATGGRVSAEKGGTRDSGAKRAITLGTAVDPRHLTSWGPYAAAIARWERVLGRAAPPPTEGRWVKTRECQDCGSPDWFHHWMPCLGVWRRWAVRLAPAFVEWMQGLPAGWVTDVPGITRNAALKMLGNGVCVQQSVAAYTVLGVSPALWADVAA